jgi:hypothetical protein
MSLDTDSTIPAMMLKTNTPKMINPMTRTTPAPPLDRI